MSRSIGRFCSAFKTAAWHFPVTGWVWAIRTRSGRHGTFESGRYLIKGNLFSRNDQEAILMCTNIFCM